MKKPFLCLGVVLAFFLLIILNQKRAQWEILMSSTPEYKVTLINPPTRMSSGDSIKFAWEVTAPDTSTASTTTIYYSPTSSPSALTTNDSPQAVDYSNKLPDYQEGTFFLPDTFSSSINLFKGTVFYRAYAMVNNQHLWSDEVKLEIY